MLRAMTDEGDDARRDELEAREHLIDAEVEAKETLEEAEQLHEPEPPAEDDADDESA
jgi:hypothetical protein